jgi:predicted amidohydrolase YtcJ
MNMNKTLALFLVVLTVLACNTSAPTTTADLIIHHARVWTGEGDSIFREAIAIRDNRILATGSNNEILAMKGDSTELIDAGGKLVTPGFNDAHIHFLSGSMILSNVDLLSTTSLAEMKAVLLDYAKKHPEKKWLTGRGWQYGFFPGGMPDKSYLDSLVPDRPVYIRAYDGHTGLANSKAMEWAGINRNTVYNGFGQVVKDAKGEPTGAFLEGAQSLVGNAVPEPGFAEKLDAIRNGLRYAASLGITSVQNANGDREEFSLYDSLYKTRELTLRLNMGFSVDEETPEKDIQYFISVKNAPRDTLWLKGRSIKFMLDGVIESHTAVMHEPYSDLAPDDKMQQKHYAIPLPQYNALVQRLDAEGFQLFTHAIGDGAVNEVLNAYEKAAATNSPRERRHRIEHIEQVRADDLPRFAKLRVLPSMQPIHADPGTTDVWSKAVGEDRLPRSFAWNAMLNNGATLVYGADWPACISLDPMRGLHSAVNRRTITGEPPAGWVPEQRIGIAEALRAYTINSAYASFDEGNKGMLLPGRLADLVMLSQDLFSINPMDIHKTRVLLTIVDGRKVFERN